MEDLYDSAIPELLHTNTQAQREASLMYIERRAGAPDYIDLRLTPDFMKSKDGMLMTDPEIQKNIAREVMAGLHEAWHGTKIFENPISNEFTEKYWEFVDDEFMPWTVVELHNSKPMLHEVGLSAYMIRGPRRPTAYQQLLDASDREKQSAKDQVDVKKESPDEAISKPTATRRKRAAKAIGKWLKEQADKPAPKRVNRWH